MNEFHWFVAHRIELCIAAPHKNRRQITQNMLPHALCVCVFVCAYNRCSANWAHCCCAFYRFSFVFFLYNHICRIGVACVVNKRTSHRTNRTEIEDTNLKETTVLTHTHTLTIPKGKKISQQTPKNMSDFFFRADWYSLAASWFVDAVLLSVHFRIRNISTSKTCELYNSRLCEKCLCFYYFLCDTQKNK